MDAKLKASIVAALGSLDTTNDEHWTTEGMPRMDVVSDLVKQDLTRAEVTAAAKGFSRKTPTLDDGSKKEAADETVAEQKPAQVVQSADPISKPLTAGDPTPVIVSAEQLEELPDDEEDLTAAVIAADESLSDEQKAQIELKEKRSALTLAQREYSEAQKRMDVVIVAQQDENTAASNAQAIKQFQKSQQEQRLQQAKGSRK